MTAGKLKYLLEAIPDDAEIIVRAHRGGQCEFASDMIVTKNDCWEQEALENLMFEAIDTDDLDEITGVVILGGD